MNKRLTRSPWAQLFRIREKNFYVYRLLHNKHKNSITLLYERENNEIDRSKNYI